jgi:hypothetical protein
MVAEMIYRSFTNDFVMENAQNWNFKIRHILQKYINNRKLIDMAGKTNIINVVKRNRLYFIFYNVEPVPCHAL